jgi:hypothetical protein
LQPRQQIVGRAFDSSRMTGRHNFPKLEVTTSENRSIFPINQKNTKDQEMADNEPTKPDYLLFDEMKEVSATVRRTRSAQGKKNPEDVPFGTPEWIEVSTDLMRDMCVAMGGDPDAWPALPNIE